MPSQNATAQPGAWEARQPRQAIPECITRMHLLKEAPEAQILKQAELL